MWVMNLGLYIAASGMMTEQVRQDQLTNDLANGSTPGYKPDHSVQQSFGDLLLSNTSTGQVIGPIGTGVTIKSIVTDMTQAPLQQTGQPLDFALQGTGLFAVRTPQGIRYTRDGQFSASAQGQLVDAQGDQVLGQGGAPVRVSAKGTVPANALGVFNVPGAIKQGNNLYTGAAAGRASATVRQGELEGSAVDPTHTMVDMISSMRAYEAGQKAIQSIDDTMQECASSVGSIGGN
jgi:flagellar basal-body rod protein FlgF